MSKQKEFIDGLKDLRAHGLAQANIATRLLKILEGSATPLQTRKGFDEARIAADFTRKLLKAR